ncbi:MAG: hypothetical protein QM718_04325 [Steroidobacteraceae bacterium]
MPSRRRSFAAVVVLLGALWLGALAVPAACAAPASESQIEAAIEKLRADPQLGGERQRTVLRWKSDETPARANTDNSWLMSLLAWIGELSAVIATGSRLILIALVIVLIAFVAVIVLRWWRARQRRLPVTPVAAGVIVQGLDTRPESLPQDIGTAALQLWQEGAARAAAQLLYRGLLSRLLHEHRLAIDASTTEGECLGLLQAQSNGTLRSYGRQLIGVWQAMAYAARRPDDAGFAALCQQFDAALAPDAAPTPTAGAS